MDQSSNADHCEVVSSGALHAPIQERNVKPSVDNENECTTLGKTAHAAQTTDKEGSKIAPDNGEDNNNEFRRPNCYGGLSNLGNTCYMNSALQVLASLDHFVEHVRNVKLPVDHEQKVDPSLINAFLDLMTSLAKGDTVRPEQFKKAIDDRSQLFVGYRQQDSHEFLTTLLDLLDEDYKKLNEAKKGAGEEKQSEEDDVQPSSHEEETYESHSKRARMEDSVDVNTEQPDTTLKCSRSFSKLKVEEIEELIHGPPTCKVTQSQTPITASEPRYKLVGGRMNTVEAVLTPYSDGDVSMGSTAFMTAKIADSDEGTIVTQKLMDEVSPVDSYFKMDCRVSLTCDSCRYSRSHSETYLQLSLEIGTDCCTVEDGLRKFLAPEKREVKCEKCFCETATQTMEITRLPRALLLHFKRFIVDISPDYQSITYRKNQSPLVFEERLPLNDENGVLGEFLAADVSIPERILSDSFLDCGDGIYSIRSVVNHIGSSAGCGHYTSDGIRLYSDGERKWTRFNDACVSLITEKKAIEDSARTAYMVMYELI